MLAHLPSTEVRKLSRTMSAKEPALKNDYGGRELSDTYPDLSVYSSRHQGTNGLQRFSTERTFDRDRMDLNTTERGESDYPVLYKRRSNISKSPSISSTFENSQKCSTADESSDANYSTLENLRTKRVGRSSSNREPKSNYLLLRPTSFVPHTNAQEGPPSTVKDEYFSSRYSTLPITNRLSRVLSQSSEKIQDCSDSERCKEQRKGSRFLRPNFYDSYNDESIRNPYLREKKEREIETQKILKEIRDKRKNKLRERSLSRERRNLDNHDKNSNIEIDSKQDSTQVLLDNKESLVGKSTENLLKNVSDNIKNLESNAKSIHDYVNISASELGDGNTENHFNEIDKKNCQGVMHDYINLQPTNSRNFQLESENVNDFTKKEKDSKIIRPKSYPTECISHKYITKIPTTNDNYSKSKINKLKKINNDRSKKSPDENTKIDEKSAKKKSNNDEEKSSAKTKLLNSIEKRLEKFRSFNNPLNNTAEANRKEKNKGDEKKSNIETTIKRLREQSVPINTEPCITESGLIKRAVSVEDFASLEEKSKSLQASKKSVSKILNLFKKYEEKNGKNEKVKLKKQKENLCQLPEIKQTGESQNVAEEKTDFSSEKDFTAANILEHEFQTSDSLLNHTYQNISTSSVQRQGPIENAFNKKHERPLSLNIEKRKQSQYSGVKSDSLLVNENSNRKASKLPMNIFRRSLNLENSFDSGKHNKIETKQDDKELKKTEIIADNFCEEVAVSFPKKEFLYQLEPRKINSYENVEIPESIEDQNINRKKLHLDFSKVPKRVVPKINIETKDGIVNENKENEDSLPTDSSSLLLSLSEDVSNGNDTWSVCSDYHPQDLISPVSPTGQFYSADEGESVIDRIRRKSFYSRFNEKKKSRKTNTPTSRHLYSYNNLAYNHPGYSRLTKYDSSGKKSSSSNHPLVRNTYELPEESNKNGYDNFTHGGYVNVPNYNYCNPKTDRSFVYLSDKDNIPMNNSPGAFRVNTSSHLDKRKENEEEKQHRSKDIIMKKM